MSITSSLTSPVTLVLATALAAPTLYSAYAGHVRLGDAATRYLICIPVAAVMLAILRVLTQGYGPVEPTRRTADQPAARRRDDRL